jgi:hypothetical protein
MQDAMKAVTDKMAALWRFDPAMWPALQKASERILSTDLQDYHQLLLVQQVGAHRAFLFKPHQVSHGCSTVSFPPRKLIVKICSG